MCTRSATRSAMTLAAARRCSVVAFGSRRCDDQPLTAASRRLRLARSSSMSSDTRGARFLSSHSATAPAAAPAAASAAIAPPVAPEDATGVARLRVDEATARTVNGAACRPHPYEAAAAPRAACNDRPNMLGNGRNASVGGLPGQRPERYSGSLLLSCSSTPHVGAVRLRFFLGAVRNRDAGRRPVTRTSSTASSRSRCTARAHAPHTWNPAR